MKVTFNIPDDLWVKFENVPNRDELLSEFLIIYFRIYFEGKSFKDIEKEERDKLLNLLNEAKQQMFLNKESNSKAIDRK